MQDFNCSKQMNSCDPRGVTMTIFCIQLQVLCTACMYAPHAFLFMQAAKCVIKRLKLTYRQKRHSRMNSSALEQLKSAYKMVILLCIF